MGRDDNSVLVCLAVNSLNKTSGDVILLANNLHGKGSPGKVKAIPFT